MEFFYKLTFYDETKTLGSNLFYTDEDFSEIVDDLTRGYYKLLDDNLDDGEDVVEYVSRKLSEFYKIEELHIEAFADCGR